MFTLFLNATTSETQAFLRGENPETLKLYYSLDDLLEKVTDHVVVLELSSEPEGVNLPDGLLINSKRHYLSMLDALEHYYVL